MAASTYVNTLPQCSPASVGLAQAHPNYTSITIVQRYTGKVMSLLLCDNYICITVIQWKDLKLVYYIINTLVQIYTGNVRVCCLVAQ